MRKKVTRSNPSKSDPWRIEAAVARVQKLPDEMAKLQSTLHNIRDFPTNVAGLASKDLSVFLMNLKNDLQDIDLVKKSVKVGDAKETLDELERELRTLLESAESLQTERKKSQ